MKPKISIVTLFLSFSATTSLCQKPAKVPFQPVTSQSRAWVEHTKNGDVNVTEDASFNFVQLLRDDGIGYTHFLIEQSIRNKWSESREGIDGTVTAQAWNILRTGKGNLHWKFHASGNEAHPISSMRLFQVTNWPCCSSPFYNLYFSLINGKLLYVSNGNSQQEIEERGGTFLRMFGGYNHIGYTQTRFLAFGVSGPGGSQIPAIQYGTDKAIMQKLYLVGREYGDNFDVPSIAIKSMDGKIMHDLRFEGPFSFLIVLTFPDGPEVQIPVENDVLQMKKAALPAEYSLSAEGPAK